MKKIIVKKNNKGLTLLEMIISVAIMSIVIVTVTSFMVTGTKMFGASNNEIQLQEEVQIALNNVENRIIDTRSKIQCSENVYTDTVDGVNVQYQQVILTIFNDRASTAPEEYIVWNEGTGKIYYADSSAVITAASFTSNEVLASNVKEFKVNLMEGERGTTVTPSPSVTAAPSVSAQPTERAVKNKPKVQITIKVDEKGRTHTSQKVVTFRNDITVAANDTVYTGTSTGLDSKAEKVQITPQDVYLKPGDTYQFNARVTGTGYPSQLVSWSVGSGAGVTISDTGVVQVEGTAGANEVATIVAKAPENSDGNIPSDSARVHICKITGITVTTETTKIYAGSMLKVKATVAGALNNEMERVTFSIKEEEAKSWASVYSTSGVIGLNSEAKGKTFTIVATSDFDPSVSGELTVTVENTSLSDLGSDAVQANRNSSVEMIPNVVGENLASSELQIEWSIADYGGLSANQVSVGKYSGILQVAQDINYENEYHLKVAASISADRLSSAETKYITVTIPKVSISFVNGDGGAEIQKNGTVTLPYEVIGLENAASEIYATTNPSIRNSIIYVANNGVRLSIGSNVRSDKISVIATLKNTNTSDSIEVTVK